MELATLRNEIDGIDREIVALLVKRMKVCESVADYKIGKDLPVLDASREAALLEKIASLAGDYAAEAVSVYRTVLEESRALQTRRIEAAKKI